ncbi:hypothetical protein [Dictyobacter arantiisoli]|uniref:Uncharacterized protein n=1 Tax=Dictyobacter arantiisoli TaxID=2014874 RepID=A0A5A5T700_9CHLR|nr:hypothetical protein [Dictyobacter arantiisoli]GCF07250.1 hypothetical protein KDI_08140 [Dictyobacter arantiisoli]
MGECRSEVRRLRDQIETVCRAMNQMLSGYAVTARHDIINHRYSTLGTYQEELETLVGEQQALDIVIEAYNRVVR